MPCTLSTAALLCHVVISDNVAVNDMSGLESWSGQIYGAAEEEIAQTLVAPFLHQRSAYKVQQFMNLQKFPVRNTSLLKPLSLLYAMHCITVKIHINTRVKKKSHGSHGPAVSASHRPYYSYDLSFAVLITSLRWGY